MAAEKIVVPKVDTVALGKVKWENEKARLAFFQRLGAAPSGTSVFATLTRGAWEYGEHCRETGNNAPDHAGCFEAFNAGRLMPGGGGALAKTTAETYASIVKTCVETAAALPYDGTPIVTFLGEKCGSVAFGSRAKLLSDIVAAHPKTCPDEAAMRKCIVSVPSNLSDDISAIVTRLANMAADADENSYSPAKVMVAHGLVEHFRTAMAGLRALEAASIAAIPKTPPKKRGKAQTAASKALLG